MAKKIQIKISNRGIYTIIAAVIILITAVVVNASWANPQGVGHSEDEIDLSNYYTKSQVYTKGEVDNQLSALEGTCQWEGWNLPQCAQVDRCLVFDCNLAIGECACDITDPPQDPLCCSSWGQKRCTGTWVEAYYCDNKVITAHEGRYTNCIMKYDASCPS